MPDDPPAGYPSREDWAQAIKAKITWLADAATELGQMRNTAGLLARVNEEITRLRDFLGTGGGVR